MTVKRELSLADMQRYNLIQKQHMQPHNNIFAKQKVAEQEDVLLSAEDYQILYRQLSNGFRALAEGGGAISEAHMPKIKPDIRILKEYSVIKGKCQRRAVNDFVER